MGDSKAGRDCDCGDKEHSPPAPQNEEQSRSGDSNRGKPTVAPVKPVGIRQA